MVCLAGCCLCVSSVCTTVRAAVWRAVLAGGALLSFVVSATAGCVFHKYSHTIGIPIEDFRTIFAKVVVLTRNPVALA